MWIYNNKKFTSEDIEDYFGFVYLIINKLSGKMYIGRKYFKRKLTYPPLKGKKRKRKFTKESDWKDYYSSSKLLKEDIEKLGKENFERIILSLHKTKMSCNYTEVEEQFKRNVLCSLDNTGNRLYYNNNILSRYFGCPEIVSKETRKNK